MDCDWTGHVSDAQFSLRNRSCIYISVIWDEVAAVACPSLAEPHLLPIYRFPYKPGGLKARGRGLQRQKKADWEFCHTRPPSKDLEKEITVTLSLSHDHVDTFWHTLDTFHLWEWMWIIFSLEFLYIKIQFNSILAVQCWTFGFFNIIY